MPSFRNRLRGHVSQERAGALLRRCLAPAVAVGAIVAFLALSAAPAAAATITATVHTGGTHLNVRTGPSTKYAVTSRLANRSTVSIACRVTGQRVAGTVRTTTQWDRLTSGRYVSHAYVATSKAIAACVPPKPVVSSVPPLVGPHPGMSNADFIAASVAPARQGYREFHVPVSVTIAQGILESGWGNSGLSAKDNNLFGIKCFDGVHGPIATGCHIYNTYECKPLCLPTTASFRTYATTADSFRDHGRFLTVNQRYLPAFAYTHDPDQFLYQMWKAGYATSPTYVTNVKALMHKYNLYQYDLK